MLLDYGADVSLLDAETMLSLLGGAAFFGCPEVVAILLEADSERSQRNKHGLTPLGCTVGGTQGRWKQFLQRHRRRLAEGCGHYSPIQRQ